MPPKKLATGCLWVMSHVRMENSLKLTVSIQPFQKINDPIQKDNTLFGEHTKGGHSN